jgi:ATP-dependent protease Clp ATPase subunit
MKLLQTTNYNFQSKQKKLIEGLVDNVNKISKNVEQGKATMEWKAAFKVQQ